jgi:hypothetical protein
MATYAHTKAFPFPHELDNFQPCSLECTTLTTGTCPKCHNTLDMYSQSPLRHSRKIIRATHISEPSPEDLTLASRLADRIVSQPHALGHRLPNAEPAFSSNTTKSTRSAELKIVTRKCRREHLEHHRCRTPSPCNLKHLDDHTCKPCQDDHLSDHSCPAFTPCLSPHLSAHDCEPCSLSHLSDHTCPPCTQQHLSDHTCPPAKVVSKPCKLLHLEDITPQQAQEIYGLIDPDDAPPPPTTLTPDAYSNSTIKTLVSGLLSSSALADLFQSDSRPPKSVLLAVNSLRQQLQSLAQQHDALSDTSSSLPPLSFPDSEPEEEIPNLSPSVTSLVPSTVSASDAPKHQERSSHHDKRGRPSHPGFFSLLATKPSLDTRKRKDSVQSQPALPPGDDPTRRPKRSSSVMSSQSRVPLSQGNDDIEDTKSLLRQKLEHLEHNINPNAAAPTASVGSNDSHRRQSSHPTSSSTKPELPFSPLSPSSVAPTPQRGSLEYHKINHDRRHASSRCHHCAREFNVEQY